MVTTPITPSEEKQQPQVITSPDGKLQIIKHHMFIDVFDICNIKGVVKNISSESELNGEIKVDFYDINNEYIDTEVEPISCLKLNVARAFVVRYAGPRHIDTQYYKISLTVSEIPTSK